MSGYGLLPRSIFTEDAVRALSDRAWRGFTYMSCGPHAHIIGAGYLPDGYLGADLGWDPETVSQTVSELLASGFVRRFQDDRYFAIPRYFEWNKIHNKNVMIAAVKELDRLPDDPAIGCVIKGLEPFIRQFQIRLPDRFETVRQRLANGPQQPSPSPSPSLSPSPSPSPSPARKREEAGNDHLADRVQSIEARIGFPGKTR